MEKKPKKKMRQQRPKAPQLMRSPLDSVCTARKMKEGKPSMTKKLTQMK